MKPQRAIITTATPGRTLDASVRMRRYYITMGIRVACFALMIFVDGYWRLVALLGAAFLPAIAVLFANNADHRPLPIVRDDEPFKALPAGVTVSGDVED